MNMAMGPCLAWPRSHSNVRGMACQDVRMSVFQGSPPPQNPLSFFHSTTVSNRIRQVGGPPN